MSAQHTPGPWELRPDAMGGFSALIFPKDGEFPVASLTGYHARLGQRLPNALLISAAPELLDALELLVALNMDDDETTLEAIAKARAAIAKATGSAA